MVNTVFSYLCAMLIIIIIIVETAALVFVSVHEVFREKREKLRDYFNNKK